RNVCTYSPPLEGRTARVAARRGSSNPASNASRSTSMASHRARAAARVARSLPWGTAGFGLPSQRLSHSCSAQTMWHTVPCSPPRLLFKSRKYDSAETRSSAAKHSRLAQALYANSSRTPARSIVPPALRGGCQLPGVEHARLNRLALDQLIVPDHRIAHRAPHHPHILPQDAVGDGAVRHATSRLERDI